MNNKLLFAYKKKEREDFAFPLFFIIAIFYISFYFSSSFTNVPFRSVSKKRPPSISTITIGKP